MSNTTQFPCLSCGYAYTKAKNTNSYGRGIAATRRKRACLSCKRGFVTYEVTASDFAFLKAARKWIAGPIAEAAE
jgi:transcriptional regulator NrdR family protein